MKYSQDNEDNCAEVFFDVTSFIHNLPEIIERVEVKLDDDCDVSDYEFDNHEKKSTIIGRVPNAFKRINNHSPECEGNRRN